MKYHILINGNSGGALKKGAAAFDAMVKATDLGIESFDLHQGDGFGDKMRALAATEHPVLIGGGDGTIAHAASVFMECDKPFGILPMGTMNMLAQDLGIPSVLQTPNIFDLYKTTRLQSVDVGMVNDRPFLCCAAIGTIPEASVFRESFRHVPAILMIPRLTAYIMDQMDVAHMRNIDLVADGREMGIRTAALVISNNRFADAAEADHKLAKASLQDGMLGIYSAAPQSLFQRIQLLMHLQQGALDIDPSLSAQQAESVLVRTEKDEELVSIDGEPVKLQTPLAFYIKPGALRIIVPTAASVT